jgi:hypothetical protein
MVNHISRNFFKRTLLSSPLLFFFFICKNFVSFWTPVAFLSYDTLLLLPIFKKTAFTILYHRPFFFVKKPPLFINAMIITTMVMLL